MRKLYLCLLALTAIVCDLDRANAQVAAPSLGAVPAGVSSKESPKDVILPSVANPASRAFVYRGAGPFQFNKHSLANTVLTAIGAPVPFGFPGAAAWVTTTNQYYVVDQLSPFSLYTVDTVTGTRTLVANCTGVPHTSLTGMTWDRTTNTMYGVSSSLAASQLLTINITTGVCTPIGAPSITHPGAIMINAAPGGTLFGVDIVNDRLFRWNKTTGVATMIGLLGIDANFGQDGHFDLSDGQYYWAAFNNVSFQPELRTIDTTTGTSTLIASYGGGGPGQVQTMGIYTPLNPANDDCVNAISMTCNTSATGSTATATVDGPATSCTGGSVAPDVWYSIVGTGVPITASLCGSGYDTKLDIYTGNCGALTSVVCNDDFCGLQSQVVWPGTVGVVYLIRVHGFIGATGNFTLNISCPPSNDACANAININCGQTINGTTVGSTLDPGAGLCVVSTTTAGVWYTYIGSGGNETLSLCSAASFDTKLSVYTGTCAALVCVTGNDDFCGLRSQVTFATTAGTRYYVLVHGFGGQTGTFSLARTCEPCVGVPSPGAITGSSGPYCPGTSVTLTLAGNTIANGITYQWRSSTTPGGPYNIIPGATSISHTFNTTTTTYFIVSVTCTNPGGGTGNTVEFPVNVSNLVHSNVLATPNVACSPGATVITGTVSGTAALAGNYTHTLTGPGVIGAPTLSGARNANVSFPVTVIPAGVHTYTLTSTDPIGCTVSTNITMTVNQTPIITLTTTPPSTPPGTNYSFTTSAGNAIVPGTVLVAGSRGDDVTAVVALPFPYDAYGTAFNSLRVSSNGNIQFGGAGNGTFSNTCPLPTATALGFPNFMPHWDDLRTDINAGDGVFTSVSGVAPNRIFNIEWRATLFSGGGTINFEARLFEGQQRVDFIYGTITNNGVSASIGLQAAVAPTTLFTQYSCNTASLSSGLGISFVFPAPLVTICNGDIVRIDASAVPGSPQTFNTGATNIHIPAGGNTVGNASPYPGVIPVSGLITTGVTVRSVTITNYSHTLPDDVDMVLVSPTGQSVILMSDAGGSTAATGQTFVFDDAAVATLADAVFNPSGSYKPTNFGAGDNWPAPGPLGTPVSTTLSSFTGNPNGNWSLYVVDDLLNNTGFISDWSITFTVPQRVIFSPQTNLFTNAGATIAYTGTPEYTVWARPSVNTTYTATSTINGCTSTRSVSIVVNNPPVITTQPTALAAPLCPGFNAVYTVVATGTNLTYQWQISTDAPGLVWNNIADGPLYSGTTTPTLTVLAVTTTQNGHRFRVLVGGVCPPTPVTSNVVVLTVATPPTITTQPANRTVCAPDPAVFTVVVGGTPTPAIFQWQVSANGNPAGPWVNLTTGGSYTSTLTVSPTAISQSGSLYRVIVTNGCGQSVTSANALLTVNAATPVTITPLPLRICLSDTLIPLTATPVGGSWSGIGVSGFNFVPGVTAVGTYTLTYTYSNAAGCTSTGTVLAKVEDCPERIRRLADNAVIVFPNPNNGRFNFKMNSVLYNFLGMRVYNTAGQLVHTQVFNGLVYGRVVPINLSHLPSGAYMVKFTYDDGIRTSEKTFPVIIQRN